ncbi:metallopeptidase TldD-related protein [Tumidithrix elongata RA019]|uniref:Metallopeptidase TldD-related protein n=1 Tax=Tumidithrix elongata BACA0141 TaxID=2716417 RepID=A0AAW9Q0K0_9CYAN|nr:metallopeptidase TldD-related protein [Tumidithrix elongata RA019]
MKSAIAKLSPEQTLDYLLTQAKTCTESAEAYYLSTEDTPIEFENNRLKSLQTKAQQGVALRVIAHGKIGFASSTDLSRLDDLVAAAVQTAEIGEPADFEFASEAIPSNTVSEVELSPQPTTDRLVTIGDRLISQVRAYNPEILVNVDFHLRSRLTAIATNSGVMATRRNHTTSSSLGGNLVKGEDFLQAYSYEVVRQGEPNYDRLVEQVIQKYRWSETLAQVHSGTLPVLFTPRAVASTIGGLFDTVLSGQAIAQKASPLADKLGQTLFDRRLTIFEDPSLGVSACRFDDEGTPTSAKTFINQGAVECFYWDRRWAAKAERRSTGNGFRGGLSRPFPNTINLCIAPSKTSYADLIAQMEEGLIVDQVLGAGQSNQLAGEFSVNLDLGYKVERGKIVGRVKNTMVAGNIFAAFKDLIDLSSETEWVGGGALVPAILFAQLGVAARS